MGHKDKLVSVVVASLGLVASFAINLNMEFIMTTFSTFNVHINAVMVSLAVGFGLLEGLAS